MGLEAELLKKAVKEVRAVTFKPLIVKLSPQVTDITVMAKSAKMREQMQFH